MLYYLFISTVMSSCLNAETEDAAIEYSRAGADIDEDCIVYALEKNWIDATYNLIVSALDQSKEIPIKVKELLKKSDEKVYKKIISYEKNLKYQVIVPAFRWAQSPELVFLDVKFSHRLEAPGCSNLTDPIVNITQTAFYFTGKCLRSGQKFKFLLSFQLFEDIIAEETSYNYLPTGRLNVVLKKTAPVPWALPNKGKKPSNLHVWWEIKEKYSKEMSKITSEDDEDSPKKPITEDLPKNSSINEETEENTKKIDL
jgi:hypothetical protein